MALGAVLPSLAGAQTSRLMFSLDYQGPLMNQPATGTNAPLTDADILLRANGSISPGENPRILKLGDYLDAYSLCAGHSAGTSCGLEVNAFSWGRDARLRPGAGYEFAVYFSVDEFAVGSPVPPNVPGPTLFGEAARLEAAGDVFTKRFMGPGPIQNAGGFPVGIADGDGIQIGTNQSVGPGLGLIEPLPPTQGGVDLGDNLDALDIGVLPDITTDLFYFSLESDIDRCNEPGATPFDSAGIQVLSQGTFASAADILFHDPVLNDVMLYAPAARLGLDRMGLSSDDIDAIVVFDNGDGVFQAPTKPYSWLGADPTDLVLFSVRCGSATIGMPDDEFNLPISQGDILIYYAGDQFPSIFIAAEAMGLETVSRGGMTDDELDALDILDDLEEPFKDCNMNGVEDSDDINMGTSDDCDVNGVPDECEDDWVVFCDCTSAADAPCGNTAGLGEGCLNQSGTAGKLRGSGTTSVYSDFLTLEMSGLNPSTFALAFMGDSTASVTVGNGRRCVSPGTQGIFRLSVDSTMGGSYDYGPGILGDAGMIPMGPTVLIGSSWGFQVYYRDTQMGCAPLNANFTNALLVTFTP